MKAWRSRQQRMNGSDGYNNSSDAMPKQPAVQMRTTHHVGGGNTDWTSQNYRLLSGKACGRSRSLSSIADLSEEWTESTEGTTSEGDRRYYSHLPQQLVGTFRDYVEQQQSTEEEIPQEIVIITKDNHNSTAAVATRAVAASRKVIQQPSSSPSPPPMPPPPTGCSQQQSSKAMVATLVSSLSFASPLVR